jgi:hypothetical protein
MASSAWRTLGATALRISSSRAEQERDGDPREAVAQGREVAHPLAFDVGPAVGPGRTVKARTVRGAVESKLQRWDTRSATTARIDRRPVAELPARNGRSRRR